MISVYTLLYCPLCKGTIDKSLKCLSCGETYTTKDGVYIMISSKLSKQEWKWKRTIFSVKQMKKLKQEYKHYINEETRKAQKVWLTEMKKYIDNFHGFVVDIATGLGGLLEALLKSRTNFFPIATDVDPNVLVWTKRMMEKKYSKEFLTVATDVKHFAFKDCIFDYATSLAGFNNILNTSLALKEVYRTLKPKGKLVVMHCLVEENSNSAKLARQHGLEKAVIEKCLISDLNKIGFKKVKIDIVASAIWAENPMDLFPVAGDTQYFAIIRAEK